MQHATQMAQRFFCTGPKTSSSRQRVHATSKRLPRVPHLRPARSVVPRGKSNSADGGSIKSTPLREANRGVMLGVLTLRAARTLIVYLQETNIIMCQWLVSYMARNPINLSGSREDACGDTFLKTLLSMPAEEAKFYNGVDAVYCNNATYSVDPRCLAQRILAIRAQLALELSQDLAIVPQDNADILERSFRASLENAMKAPAAAPRPAAQAATQPVAPAPAQPVASAAAVGLLPAAAAPQAAAAPPQPTAAAPAATQPVAAAAQPAVAAAAAQTTVAVAEQQPEPAVAPPPPQPAEEAPGHQGSAPSTNASDN